MVRKSAGQKKKELILNTCKKLFYEKGYKDTTFGDICNEADIFAGTITYHFENKIKIAGIIRAEFEYKEDCLIKSKCKDLCDLKLQNAIEIINYFELLNTDYNIKRFMYETYQEAITSSFVFQVIKSFFACHVNEYNLNIDDKKLNLITGSYIGMERELLNMWFNEINKYDSKELSSYVISTMYKFLGYDYLSIIKIIDNAKEIYPTLQIDFDYFKYFEYKKY